MKNKFVALTYLLMISFTMGYSPSPYGVAMGKNSGTKFLSDNIKINDPSYKNQWSIGFTKSDKAWKNSESKERD